MKKPALHLIIISMDYNPRLPRQYSHAGYGILRVEVQKVIFLSSALHKNWPSISSVSNNYMLSGQFQLMVTLLQYGKLRHCLLFPSSEGCSGPTWLAQDHMGWLFSYKAPRGNPSPDLWQVPQLTETGRGNTVFQMLLGNNSHISHQWLLAGQGWKKLQSYNIWSWTLPTSDLAQSGVLWLSPRL